MFTTLWNFIKGVLNKMIGQTTIEQAFHVTSPISDRMSHAIELWSDMYENHAPWLHEPNDLDVSRVVSLGIPSFIASEKARMATLEMESEITAPLSKNSDGTTTSGTSARADYLNEQYKKLTRKIRTQLEYGIAKGGLVIKPYPVIPKDKSKATIEFDFVQADCFFPLHFDPNGKILEAAFIQRKADKGKLYSRLEYHKLDVDNSTIIVKNLAFVSQNSQSIMSANHNFATDLGRAISLKDVPEWSALEPETKVENVDKLLFAYFRMPEANTIDMYSPLGVSGYSRVVSLIRDADEQYSRLLWEFEGGELAVDVDRDALNIAINPEDGRPLTVLPTKQNRLFRKIDLNAEDTYNVFSPTLRDESLLNGLNSILMRIEDNTGLSRGTLSEVTLSEARTATELKILKQRSYATNADIQYALEDTLKDAIYVMNVYCDLYNLAPAGEYETSFEWDDSIIVDVESELSKRLTLMQNGLASKLENRMWYFGETEAQARKALDEIAQEQEFEFDRELDLMQKQSTNLDPSIGTPFANQLGIKTKQPLDRMKDNKFKEDEAKKTTKGNPNDKKATAPESYTDK